MTGVSKTEVEPRRAFVRLLIQRRLELLAEPHERAFLRLLDQSAFGHRIAFKHARRSVPADKDCGDVSMRYQLINQEFFCLAPRRCDDRDDVQPRLSLVERLHRLFATQKSRRQLADLIIRRALRYVQDSFLNRNLIADDLASLSWGDDRDSSPGRIFSTRTVHLLAQETQRDEDALRRFLCTMFWHWHNLHSAKSHFLLSWHLHEIAPELNHDWTAIRRKLEKRGLAVSQFRCDELGRVTNDVTESLRKLSSQQCSAASPRSRNNTKRQRKSREKLGVPPTE